MLIENKIKKRIKTIETFKNRTIKEVEITKEEAEQLGDIREIEGVKLIVVEKLDNRIKKDCFGYQECNECYALKQLYCSREICKFYRNDINIQTIESDIQKYAFKK